MVLNGTKIRPAPHPAIRQCLWAVQSSLNSLYRFTAYLWQVMSLNLQFTNLYNWWFFSAVRTSHLLQSNTRTQQTCKSYQVIGWVDPVGSFWKTNLGLAGSFGDELWHELFLLNFTGFSCNEFSSCCFRLVQHGTTSVSRIFDPKHPNKSATTAKRIFLVNHSLALHILFLKWGDVNGWQPWLVSLLYP